jgi:hypothetical protein
MASVRISVRHKPSETANSEISCHSFSVRAAWVAPSIAGGRFLRTARTGTTVSRHGSPPISRRWATVGPEPPGEEAAGSGYDRNEGGRARPVVRLGLGTVKQRRGAECVGRRRVNPHVLTGFGEGGRQLDVGLHDPGLGQTPQGRSHQEIAPRPLRRLLRRGRTYVQQLGRCRVRRRSLRSFSVWVRVAAGR